MTNTLHPDNITSDSESSNSFLGSWDATLVTPIGVLLAVIDIKQINGVLGGTAATDAETVEIYDAKIDDDTMTWTQKVTTPMNLTLNFTVTVEGDSMSGSYKAGIFPASKVSATRRSA